MDLSNGVSLAAIVISLVALIETVRVRRIQQAQFDYSRGARVRMTNFVFNTQGYDIPGQTKAPDSLGLMIANLGERMAIDLDIRCERGGIRRAHGIVYGLPPGLRKEIELDLGSGESNAHERFTIYAAYRDFKPHRMRVVLEVEPHPYPMTGQGRVPKVIEATLDGKPHPEIDVSYVS